MSDQQSSETKGYELITKQFESQNIRIVEVDSKPWFVARDISDILGFGRSQEMTRYLDDDEKGVFNTHTLGGMQGLTIINESGLYSSILRSRKSEAKRFKKWITSEVLPSIRKTGGYSIADPPKIPNFNDPVAAARAWADAKEAELKANLELIEAVPKIEFYDELKDSKGLYSVGDAAKLLGTGRNRLFDLFRINNIFMGIVPYQRYIEDGYFKVKADSVNDHVQKQAFITPKGLQWIKKRFFK